MPPRLSRLLFARHAPCHAIWRYCHYHVAYAPRWFVTTAAFDALSASATHTLIAHTKSPTYRQSIQFMICCRCLLPNVGTYVNVRHIIAALLLRFYGHMPTRCYFFSFIFCYAMLIARALRYVYCYAAPIHMPLFYIAAPQRYVAAFADLRCQHECAIV